MKKIIILLSVFILIITSCRPSQAEAISYNDIIMNVIDSLSTEHTLLLNQIDGHNIDSLKITHQLFLNKTKWGLERSKKIGAFAENKTFINAAQDYFTIMNLLGNNEAKQMVEIMTKDSSKITYHDIDKINELATKFDEGYGKVYEKVLVAQINFAKEWNFKLNEAKD